MRSGKKIKVGDMDDFHLVNTMRGLLRRLPVHFVAWHYVAMRVANKNQGCEGVYDAVYKFISYYVIHHAPNVTMGDRTRRQCDCLTAMRLEAAYRDIEWWDHDRYCECESCHERAKQGAEFHANNPNYKPM